MVNNFVTKYAHPDELIIQYNVHVINVNTVIKKVYTDCYVWKWTKTKPLVQACSFLECGHQIVGEVEPMVYNSRHLHRVRSFAPLRYFLRPVLGLRKILLLWNCHQIIFSCRNFDQKLKWQLFFSLKIILNFLDKKYVI